MYRPGCLEHYVLHRLRSDPAFVPELDFVMTLDGQLIGQNMFMKAVIACSHGRYYGLGDFIGKFGYSVQKPAKVKSSRKKK